MSDSNHSHCPLGPKSIWTLPEEPHLSFTFTRLINRNESRLINTNSVEREILFKLPIVSGLYTGDIDLLYSFFSSQSPLSDAVKHFPVMISMLSPTVFPLPVQTPIVPATFRFCCPSTVLPYIHIFHIKVTVNIAFNEHSTSNCMHSPQR